jgi:hypothetical protein
MYAVRGLTAALMALALLGGHGLAQDAKKEATSKVRGQLPPNYAKLGLSAEQKQQIYKIQATYDQKMEELQSQLKKLKSDEKQEIDKVLTDAQRARLREIANEKLPGDGGQ